MTNQINIDIRLPMEAIKDIKKFQKTLNAQFNCREIDEACKIELNRYVKQFEEDMKAKYPFDKNISIKVKGDLAYYETSWTLTNILEHYQKEFPERYQEKKQYTRIEVNNMLFDLQLADIIGRYGAVAVPLTDCSYNNEIFSGVVSVLSRYE